MKSSNIRKNWGEMIPELLLMIADHLLFHDYVAFRGVCQSWRNIATKEYFSNSLPLLMLAHKDCTISSGSCGLYCLTTKRVQYIVLRDTPVKRCTETLGWLVMVHSISLNMELFHPFSRIHVELPHKSTFPDTQFTSYSTIHKAVLSTSPSFAHNYVLVVIYGLRSQLAFWRPGNQRWNCFETTATCFSDILYYKSQFHAIDAKGSVYVLDFDLDRSVGIVKICIVLNPGPEPSSRYYLVDSAGALLLVARDLRELYADGKYGLETRSFKVYEVDMNRSLVSKRTNDLGSRSIFLGMNASSSVDTCKFPAIKSNCIYYTDFIICFDQSPRHDTGIYSLSDGKRERLCEDQNPNFNCPRIWVNPSF